MTNLVNFTAGWLNSAPQHNHEERSQLVSKTRYKQSEIDHPRDVGNALVVCSNRERAVCETSPIAIYRQSSTVTN